MKNWSTKYRVEAQDKFIIWKLEQLINFGLDKEKIKKSELKKYWNVIDIDPDKRKFLSLFIK